MSITYTWKITGLKTKTEGLNTNSVVQTYWEKIGTDENGNTGKFSGATPFTSTTMPPGDTFVPFEQLTEEMVIKWVQDIVVGDYENHINEKILQQIEHMKNPTNETTLPWIPKN